MEERLQKYMARCGVASRRKCEEIILAGKVKVNGMIINELGTKVTLDDIVEYEGKRILPEENKVYIMLNKPEGVITSVKDEKGRKKIMRKLAKWFEESLESYVKLMGNTYGWGGRL